MAEHQGSLFRERTALGRQRSTLALTVIAALLLAHSAREGVPVGAVGAAALGAAAAAARSPRALGAAAVLAALFAAAVTVL